MYDDQDELEYLDDMFITATTDNITLYGYYTGEAFNMAENSFDKSYTNFFKNSRYGIDNGYFIGSLNSRNPEKKVEPTGQIMNNQQVMENLEEKIEIELTIPKGTRIVRISNTEPLFMLQREACFKYGTKKMKKSGDSEYVNVKTTLINSVELINEIDKSENTLNQFFKENCNEDKITFKILPLGLNADYVIQQSRIILEKSITTGAWKTILKDIVTIPYEISFSDYGYVNSPIFDLSTKNMSLEEKQKEFDKEFLLEEDGYSALAKDRSWAATNLKIGRSLDRELLLTETNNYFSGVLLHELFHFAEYNTKNFEKRSMFKETEYMEIKKYVKKQEERKLTNLLGSPYCQESTEEFIAEAFMAKYHPTAYIKNGFPDFLSMTNRVIDNLYDTTPPSPPANLIASEIKGESVKLVFNHSEDNIGVQAYNVYQDEKLIDTILTEKDSNNLSYPKPGNKNPTVEHTIKNLTQYTKYSFYITALDEAQNESSKSNILYITTKDTEAPVLTGDIRTNTLTSTNVLIHWPEATDNVEVAKIKITKSNNAKLLDSAEEIILDGNSTTYNDKEIITGKDYYYHMTALDAEGNESKKSNVAHIKTKDTDDNRKNEDRAENVTSSSAILNLNGLFSFPSSFKAFKVFSYLREGNKLEADSEFYTETDKFKVDLLPDQEYLFVVIPVDKEKKPLDRGTGISVTSKESILPPTDLIATKITSDSFSLEWKKNENSNTITGYDIYQDDRLLKTIEGNMTKTNISRLKSNTRYKYTIKSKTNNGNSEFSEPIYITTKPICPFNDDVRYSLTMIEDYKRMINEGMGNQLSSSGKYCLDHALIFFNNSEQQFNDYLEFGNKVDRNEALWSLSDAFTALNDIKGNDKIFIDSYINNNNRNLKDDENYSDDFRKRSLNSSI